MILYIDVSYSIQGIMLDPRQIEKDLSINFSEIEIKGSIGKVGRYKNMPIPYSYGRIKNKKEENNINYSEIERIATIASIINAKKEYYNIEYDNFFYYFLLLWSMQFGV